jgi:copper chaperone
MTQRESGDIVSVTQTYVVEGMTCGHCVNAVTQEVAAIDGVESVDVVLDGGTVTVVSAEAIERDAVAAAVDEAGYTLVEA